MANETALLQSLGLVSGEDEVVFSPEEELLAYAEIMQSDVNTHADAVLMSAYVEGTLPEEYIPVLYRHLSRCASCRGNLESLLEVHKVSETTAIYRILREFQLRARQDLALQGVVLKKTDTEYRVSIHEPATGVWQEQSAQLPEFAHHKPNPGESVLVWKRKDGGAWLLGETWEAVHSLDTEEQSKLPLLTRQERLEPAYPYTSEQIADLLKHASSH